MYQIEFGKLIDKLIYLSGQKNYSLAMRLGYDVSYISKWINLNMLPSAKNINKISKVTSKFIVESSSESSLDNISEYFEIKFSENDIYDKRNIIQNIIEKRIYESYQYSYDKYNNKENQKYEGKNNSIQIIDTSVRKKYLSEIMNINSLFYCDMIVLCNLFSLNKEDKVNIFSINNFKNKEIFKVRYLIDFDKNINDIIFDVILFIEMVTSKNRINSQLYSCDCAPNTLITVIKDKFVHTSIYNNNRCLTTVTSHDKEVIQEMYDTLEEMINYQCKPMFRIYTPDKMITDESYINYIMDEDLRWILGEVNELLMPSDLFLEIGQSIFGDNENIIIKLKKIDTILRNITYNSSLDIIVFESAIKKYISNGNITFFNHPVSLDMKQRQRQLSYIIDIISNKKNINFRIIENSLLEDIEIYEPPSLYLSKTTSFLKEEYKDNNGNYMIVNNKKLDNIFNNFFNKVWIERVDLNNNIKDETKNIILESLRYINILNDNIKNT